MRIMTIVGARPEFIQAATVSKAIRQSGHEEILVHTGQHYDSNMSDVFFDELEIPSPDINLGVGSGSHAWQTGTMMIHLEQVIQEHDPDWVLVYGDTNSTVAASMVAAKLQVLLAHVEAGLRSFDRSMPEEINRIVTDHLSNLLLVGTQAAVHNLTHEGISDRIRLVGDVRVDTLHDMRPKATKQRAKLFSQFGFSSDQPFALATIHRPGNTDEIERLRCVVECLNTLHMPVVIPAHPRLKKMMESFCLTFNENVRAIEPVGFLDMLCLLDVCQIVITDSGGLQKEAYILKRPAITVRPSTEWVETVESGWNRLCEPESSDFQHAIEAACQPPLERHPDYYGSYGVSERICRALEDNLSAARQALTAFAPVKMYTLVS